MMILRDIGSGDYDKVFAEIIKRTRQKIEAEEDDALLLFVGSTGSGKSSLAAHAVLAYNPNANADCVGITKDSFLHVLKTQHERYKKGERGLVGWYDEVDAEKLRFMTSWVVDLTRFYMTSRIFGILHLWCWPTVETLSKTLISERVNGIFYCRKGANPREYFFFPKESLMRLIAKYPGGLTNNILLQHKDEYAIYSGRFKKCTGKFWDSYKEMKYKQASDLAEQFFDKYSNEIVYTYSKLAKEVGLTRPGLMKILNEMGEKNLYVVGEKLSEGLRDRISSFLVQKHQKSLEKVAVSEFPMPSCTNNRAKEEK